MRKAINKILTGITLTALNAGIVFADGGGKIYNIYNPYHSHKPVDTGLESGIFYLVAGILFVLGLTTLSVVKTLRTKVSTK